MMKLVKTIIFLGLLHSSFLYADEYRFGDGFQVADSPLTVGGYASSTYEVDRFARTFDLDDFAVMAYGEFDRTAFMAELEASDIYQKELGSRSDERSNGAFHIERLYGDYFFGDNERVRLGKFNSDVGFWNQMPINVLRDTTSSPYLVKDFFPKLTTGIHYESRSLDTVSQRISITVQHNRDLDSDYNNFNTDRHYSIAYEIGKEGTLWRIAGGHFRYDAAIEASYGLISVKLDREKWGFLAESVLRRDGNGGKLSYDVYGQAVWHVWPKHDLITRIEAGRSPVTRMYDQSALIGYTYRPLGNVALKAEFQAHEESLLNRWLYSFSFLF